MAEEQRLFKLDDPNDISYIHQLLFDNNEEIRQNEDNGDESDTETEGNFEEREGDSESEQDGESTEEDNEMKGDILIGKDKITKWKEKKPNPRVRRGAHNICMRLPGVIGNAKNASSPYERWKNIFTDDILHIIVTNTNIYIQMIQRRFKRERDCKITDIVEYKAFIGLLYHAGVLKSNMQSYAHMRIQINTIQNCSRNIWSSHSLSYLNDYLQ
ncbi:hypothetical protein HHI36_002381 [Cryptolaemus montrouzieri]|uniref:PiggyBac transposable element-derived protein domain-containing protein n=1 Tax=Cryptolaemus montrouzieri TaxID=559131 RepID=A0ABD2PAM8_9CUCU